MDEILASHNEARVRTIDVPAEQESTEASGAEEPNASSQKTDTGIPPTVVPSSEDSDSGSDQTGGAPDGAGDDREVEPSDEELAEYVKEDVKPGDIVTDEDNNPSMIDHEGKPKPLPTRIEVDI